MAFRYGLVTRSAAQGTGAVSMEPLGAGARPFAFRGCAGFAPCRTQDGTSTGRWPQREPRSTWASPLTPWGLLPRVGSEVAEVGWTSSNFTNTCIETVSVYTELVIH